MHATPRMIRIAKRCAADRSGVSAVEFAIVGPFFIALLLAIVCFGVYFGAANSVQLLCSDLARATVAGVTEEERVEIADAYIRQNARKYIFIAPERLTVTLHESAAGTRQFDVAVEYDASHLPITLWTDLFRKPPPVIRSSATVMHGGM